MTCHQCDQVSLLTRRSQLSSFGFTLHIMFTIFRDSTSNGSGVTDFTDSAISGEIALDRGGGGCLTPNAVNGYMPFLKQTCFISSLAYCCIGTELTSRLRQISPIFQQLARHTSSPAFQNLVDGVLQQQPHPDRIVFASTHRLSFQICLLQVQILY